MASVNPFRAHSLIVCLGAATLIIAGCGRFQRGAEREGHGISNALETAGRQISGDFLRNAIGTLASDEFEGRAPGTPGDRRARAFLANWLETLGFAPGGPDGQWEQPFDVVGITPKVPATWRFQGATSVDLRARDEFIAVSGVQAESASLDRAEVVFVGYGIEAPEYRWDDFKGVDVKGKVLLMLNNDPDWDPSLFEGVRRLYYGRWTYKYESAARHGAAGAIIIHTTPSAGYPWQVVQSSWSGEQFELPAEGEKRVQVRAWTTEAAARRIVAAAGKTLDDLVAAARSRDFAPVPLGLRTSLTLRNTLTKAQTANVAGLLEGRDPALRREVVIFSAHHDHLGIGEPDSDGDRIYNGARDNASGCAQLLAIARALSELPERPPRSILMLFVAAEEQGLLGSQFYARHPTFPAGRIAANVNYDGAGIWGRTSDITLLGLGKSSLDDVARTVAESLGLVLEGDQFPDRGFYYRSDQFSFAKIGVPALKFGTGLHVVGKPENWGREQMEAWEARRYHQPSDELDSSWNFDGMIAEARLGLYAGWVVAEARDMPAWKPGDEFEAARKAAIAATQGLP
jgi:Zn-dependent M28 family amino/carboxypeptidase